MFLRGGLEGGWGGLLFLRRGSEVGLEFLDKGVEFDGLVVVEVFELKAAFGVPRASGDVASITQEKAFLCFGILDDGEFSVGHTHDVKVAGVVLAFEEDEGFFADFEASGAGDMASDAVDGPADLSDIDLLLLGIAFESLDDGDFDVGVDTAIFGVPSGVDAEDAALDDGVCALGHLLIVEFDDDGGLCAGGGKEEGGQAQPDRRKRLRERRERLRHSGIS